MTSPAPSASLPSGRLRNGQLRQQVAAWLDAHAGPHTPASVARELNRSSGAVANAAATLARLGQADIAAGKPVRYEANAATAIAARGALPALPATPKPAPVPRPGGASYSPRALAGMPDVDALRKLRAAGVPVLLYGPPGTGKTSLVEAAFAGEVITVAGDGDTTVADLTGEYTQRDDGRYEFAYGPLVTAMTEGRVLFIDDATLISPAVLAVTYPAMDGRRQIQVKAHKGETVTAAPGFYVAAGHNPGVHGAILTEALSSRFTVQVKVSTDYDLAAALKIDARAIRAARDLAARKAAGEIGWAPQLRELIGYQCTAAILGDDAAAANLAGIAPEEDQDVVADAIHRAFGRRAAPLALGRQI